MASFAVTDISLYILLRECCSLALQAGAVIRQVHAARLAGGNAVLAGHLKEEGDCKSVATIADIRAQRVIVNELKRKFPTVAIVGEEEDDNSVVDTGFGGVDTNFHPFISTNCLDLVKEKNIKVKSDSIVLYIDPLDGTHEYVEGRVEHVQTLIGIAVNGTPLAGVVGLPFWGQDTGSEPSGKLDIIRGGDGGAVIAGVTDIGTFGFERRVRTESNILLASSSSIKQPALVAVQNILTSAPYNGKATVVPACGNKILSLLRGECSVAVFNLKTSVWDACATQALLTASGGCMTDLTGSRINYCHPSIARNGATGNVFGVVATVAGIDHVGLVGRFRLCPEVTELFHEAGLRQSALGTASDVCRDTFGIPFSTKTLSEIIGSEVASYSCPECEAHRYLMSEAARLHLAYRPGFSGPKSIFYKRAVMRDLPHVATKMHTAPSKLARDVRSYQVEVSFLASGACRTLNSLGEVNLARCLKAEIFPNEAAIDSKFSMLLEDFSPELGWYQTSMMNTAQLTAGIEALAKFHAFYWNGGVHNKHLDACSVSELSDAVWPVATHWAPSKQAPEMIGQIAEIWSRNQYFDAVSGFGNGSRDHEMLGERLQSVASAVASKCHFVDGDTAEHPFRTIIHGDAKSGNFFFRNSLSNSGVEVGLIDFQWCGFGLGATDLAYFIAGSAAASAVESSGDKELQLLRQYHSILVSAVDDLRSEEKSVVPVPSFDQLLEQYETALLDLCRIAFAYHWGRIKASPLTFDENRQRMLGPCAYNKHPDVARWLVSRCDSLLAKHSSKF